MQEFKLNFPFTSEQRVNNFVCVARVPTRTGKREKWEGIFQSGKSHGILIRLEKSWKITQNTGKLREFEINII